MTKYKIYFVLVVLAVVLLAVFLPLVFLVLLAVTVVASLFHRTKVGVATRTQATGSGSSLGTSWYIEGVLPEAAGEESKAETRVSCSFVEFDGRGDFLEFDQYQNAYQKVHELAVKKTAGGEETKQPLLMIIYCHGWKNSAQSGDVLKFNEFLIRLAGSDQMRHRKARVHGVYLGWRGNEFKPYVPVAEVENHVTAKVYGGPILSKEHLRPSNGIWSVLEQLTYWFRKKAAESQVSGVPMARTIFAVANVAKRVGVKDGNRVVVIGHSFGALMLERCLGQASVGLLSSELSWFGDKGTEQYGDDAGANEEAAKTYEAGGAGSEGEKELKSSATDSGTMLPMDLILFVNSASPSIHAHMLNGFLRMYRRGLAKMGAKRSAAPVIVSVTSSDDAATGAIHPVGNWAAPLSPSMQRWYSGLAKNKDEKVIQGYFYAHTPGHNPLLVNHWVTRDTSAAPESEMTEDDVLNANLRPLANTEDTLRFLTSERSEPGKTLPQQAWKIDWRVPPEGAEWLKKEGREPVHVVQSAYWILRCGPEIIKDHGDVWNANAMEMYAAIYRLVHQRRDAGPKPPPNP